VRSSLFFRDTAGCAKSVPMCQTISIAQAKSHYHGGTSTAHGFDHVLRVTALAECIARAEGADLEIVRTAALLHDVAAHGQDRDDHHLVGAERTVRILLNMGWPAARTEAVAHCIRAHRFRSSSSRMPPDEIGRKDVPQTLEAQCVFDADKLDAIGAVGVARAFAYSRRENTRVNNTLPITSSTSSCCAFVIGSIPGPAGGSQPIAIVTWLTFSTGWRQRWPENSETLKAQVSLPG